MKIAALILAAFLVTFASAQDPWPLERQDRWGTGRAPVGPAPGAYTTPWIYKTLNSQSPVSHPPSLGANGIGYFGTWVNNLCVKMNYSQGSVVGAFDALGFVTSTPAIAPGGNHVYAHAEAGGRIFKINTATMDYEWFMATNGWSGSPVLGPEGDPTLASTNGTIWRINAITGIPVWTRTGFSGTGNTPAFTRSDQFVLFSAGTRTYALNWATGATEWFFEAGNTVGAAAVAPDGTVMFGDSIGNVYAVHPASGTLLWSKQVLSNVAGAPAFSDDGVAYITSLDHRLYAFRVSDGFKLWSFTGNHENQKAPSVGADGRIYFFNRIGWLYAVNPNGTLSWVRNFANGEARGGISIDANGTLYLGANAPGYGLVMIRQQATTLPFTSLTMEIGDLVSGGAPEVVESDDQYANFKTSNIFNFGRTDPQIRVRLDIDSDYDRLSKFTLKFEGACSLGSSIQQKVEMFNFQTNQYELVDARPGSTSDNAWQVTVSSNATRFAQAGTGVMHLRASWFISNGPRTWTARIDQAKLVDVVPEW